MSSANGSMLVCQNGGNTFRYVRDYKETYILEDRSLSAKASLSAKFRCTSLTHKKTHDHSIVSTRCNLPDQTCFLNATCTTTSSELRLRHLPRGTACFSTGSYMFCSQALVEILCLRVGHSQSKETPRNSGLGRSREKAWNRYYIVTLAVHCARFPQTAGVFAQTVARRTCRRERLQQNDRTVPPYGQKRYSRGRVLKKR